jgi:hypothetical protein
MVAMVGEVSGLWPKAATVRIGPTNSNKIRFFFNRVLPLSEETTSGMRYRFKNARQEHGREHRSHQRALRPARLLRLRGSQPLQTIA